MSFYSRASAGPAARRPVCLLFVLLSAWATNGAAEQAPKTVLLLYGEATTLPGATALPEGARVEVVDARGSWDHVRFGSIEAWIASNTLRELARVDSR